VDPWANAQSEPDATGATGAMMVRGDDDKRDDDDETFWREMGRMPDLQALVRRYGGYDKITAAAWGRWDSANAEFQARRREGLKQ
jgi:hypothetical protein